MPEGDTVALAAERLHRALAGERLTRTELRVPAYALADLSGDTAVEVRSRGKHLLLRTDGGLSVHSHLGMDGSWRLLRPGARRPDPDHHVRAVLATESWEAVGVRLRTLEVFPTREEPLRLPPLGPDVLGPDWDPVAVVEALRRRPDRPIGEALIDQSVLAGVGNVYRSEVCFLRGVNPFDPAGAVPDLPALVDLIKRVMEANRATGSQVTTGDPRQGRSRWVYGRGGKPCRRCGTPVRRRQEADERVTYWCPSCQPAARGSEVATSPRSGA